MEKINIKGKEYYLSSEVDEKVIQLSQVNTNLENEKNSILTNKDEILAEKNKVVEDFNSYKTIKVEEQDNQLKEKFGDKFNDIRI